MTKLQKTNTQTTEQTPIEILLDIDENGMTTAKKLYTFLELDTKNYSRWCNANISNVQSASNDVLKQMEAMKQQIKQITI